jgi:hypothetical protein
MFNLVAQKSFNAAEDGLHTKHYTKGDKFTVNDKKFMDLLVKKKEAALETSIETKVVKPDETKNAKETQKKDVKPSK